MMTCKGECVKSRLSICSLGCALGLTKGLFLLLLAWAGAIWGIGVPLTTHIATFYHGYAPTFTGGLVGGLTGLIVGFIAGVFIGLFYNMCLCCCRCCCRKKQAGTTPEEK